MLKPLGNKIIVEQVQEKATQSGIIIPETVEKDLIQAKVVAVGEGKRNDKGELAPMAVKIGDRVVFKKFSFDNIEERYWVGSEDDILAIIE